MTQFRSHTRTRGRISRLARQRFKLRWCLLPLISALLVTESGCVTTRLVGVDEAIELRPSEGILVLHLSTNVPIADLRFGQGQVQNLPKGEHVQLYVVTEGRYRWSRVELSGVARLRFRVERSEDFEFCVERGRINYGGMLELTSFDRSRLAIRSVDRSAVAMEALEKRYPEIVDRYPVIYSGRGRNVFFTQYLPARARVPAGDGTPAISATAKEPVR